MPQEIAKLKAGLEKTSKAEEKATIQENLRQAEAYFAELKLMQVTLPTMTFDHSLILHRKSRTVEILWLGLTHTTGDVFVFLPKEKMLCTSNSLHTLTPFFASSYPSHY